MTARELLAQLNESGESTSIEAKSASEIGKSVLETISAFSNEPGLNGGWLVLGVTKDENAFDAPYTVVGLKNPENITTDLASQCNNSFNHPIRVRIESDTVNDKPVLVVHVPEAEDSEKPIFIKSKGLPRGAFRRIGSADVHCTDDDLELFLQQRRGDTFDAGIIPDATISDLDADSIEEYKRLRAVAKPSAEELRYSTEDLLFALKCVSRDAENVLRPTRAGLLLFGSNLALRRWFPMMRVDYIRVPGIRWVEDPDRRYETIEMRSPLIEMIRRTHAAILDDLPKAFSLPPGQLHRRDIPIVPDRVIREAIVNAVMHRSYRIHGAIQIIRYANRLEIRNPGFSLVSEERLGEPNSRTRNPTIAAVLHDTDLAETKGSGIRVMRELMEEAGLAVPAFDSVRESDCFVVTLLFHHLLSPEDLQWLGSFQELSLTDADARALVFLRENGLIDNSIYRSITRCDTLAASHHLRRLRDHGLIEQHGKGMDTHYFPTQKLLAPWSEIKPQTTEQSTKFNPQSTKLNSQSTKLNSQSTKLNSQSTKLNSQSTKLNSQSTKLNSQSTKLNTYSQLIAELPAEIQRELNELKQRVNQPEMENLLLRLCMVKPFSAGELATLLARDPRYVRQRLIKPLFRSGRLAMTIPHQPSHPQQKYRAS